MRHVKPGSWGQARIEQQGTALNLWVADRRWMTLDRADPWQAEEFLVEQDLAQGHVTITGLGMGILAVKLAELERVSSITVWEQEPDVINLWRSQCDQAGIDTGKITCRARPAQDLEPENTDCLFMDHWEGQDPRLIIAEAQQLARLTKAARVWFWPASLYFLQWCRLKNRYLDHGAYELWRGELAIEALPKLINLDVVRAQYRVYAARRHDCYWSLLADWNKAPLLE